MQLTYSLALASAVGSAFGAVLPRDDEPVPAGQCCFHLRDTFKAKLIHQDMKNGELYLDNPDFPVGWYCLDEFKGEGILRDRDNNACILTRPGNSMECLDGTPGHDNWTTAVPHRGFHVLEDYGSIQFSICDVNGKQRIYGEKAPEGLTCRQVQLNTTERKGQCKA